MFLLVGARRTDRQGPGNGCVSLKAAFSLVVCSGLNAQCSVVGLNAQFSSDATQWAQRSDSMNMIVGVALAAPTGVPSAAVFLVSAARAPLDCWSQTRRKEDALVMLRLVETDAMRHPVHMFNSQCNNHFKSLFGEVSGGTFRRCVDAGCAGHDSLLETIL
eukprot:4261259-Pyramimonas_sp.AAC.1